MPLTPEGLSNPGYNEKGIALARAANLALAETRDRRKVRKFIEEHFSVGEGETRPQLLSPELEDELEKATARSVENIRLRQDERMIVI